MIFNIMTCGVGGQGLMLLSNVIGLACAESGLNIRTAEVHGLAQRSGSIYTHIRVGEKIHSQLIPYGEANVLVGMEAIEILRNVEYLKKDGVVILNNYLWQPVQNTYLRVQNPEVKYTDTKSIILKLETITKKIHVVNALDLANQAGNPLTSNVVLLGALAKVDGFPISISDLEKAIPLVVPKKALEANLKAIKLGYDAI